MQEIFKIVKIISEFRVVVNAGKGDVKEGSVLEVFEEGSEVKDPDTGDSLGTLDYIKAKLLVEDVFPQMCVCRNYYTRKVPSGIAASLASIGAISDSFTTKEEIKELHVDAKEISGGFEDFDRDIHIGDKVRKSLV